MGVAAPLMSVQPEIRRTGAGVTNRVDHAHYECEFNLVAAGKGTYFLDDRQYDLAPGTLVWLLPGERHRLERSPELDMWVAFLHPDHLDNELLRDVAERPCRVLSSEDALALDRLLSHIGQDTDEPSLYQAGLIYAFRTAWRFSMTSPGPARKPMHPAVIQTLSILRGSAEAPSLTQVAKRCGVAQGYLGQLLIEHTGVGFVEWRNRTRLERFYVEYPKSRDLLTAALDAGFGSYSQFHRIFTELMDATPGDWARRGAQVRSVGLPAAGAEAAINHEGSTRMPWYALCEQPLPSAARWFGPAFAASVEVAPATPDDAPPVPSAVRAMGDLRRFERHFVEEVRALNPANADKLERVFSRNDLFDGYHRVFGQWHLGTADLAMIIGLELAMALMGTRRLPLPSRDQILPFAYRVRHALRENHTFDAASDEERQQVAAAFMVHAMVRHCASLGALASCSAAMIERTSTAAWTTALATLHVDCATTSLRF